MPAGPCLLQQTKVSLCLYCNRLCQVPMILVSQTKGFKSRFLVRPESKVGVNYSEYTFLMPKADPNRLRARMRKPTASESEWPSDAAEVLSPAPSVCNARSREVEPLVDVLLPVRFWSLLLRGTTGLPPRFFRRCADLLSTVRDFFLQRNDRWIVSVNVSSF